MPRPPELAVFLAGAPHRLDGEQVAFLHSMHTRLWANAPRATRGFSLVETLVATTLLTIAAGGLAHLASVATSSNQRARSVTLATLLASSKVEELLAVPWNDQVALASSADASLERNVTGFYDVLDEAGRSPEGGDPRAGVAYVRRWSVRTFAEAPGNALVLQVVVAGSAQAGGPPILARMLSVRARRDWWEPAP